jgi:hypothetical protein
MLLPRVRPIIPMLSGIFALLPFALTWKTPPETVCYQEHIPNELLFKQDCAHLAFANSHAGPLSSLSAWTYTPLARYNQSHWLVSHGLCMFRFMADSPLTEGTWRTVIEDLKALQQDCVDQKGVPGERTRRVNREPPKTGRIWVSVQESWELPRPSLERQNIQNSGGNTHPDTNQETFRRRTLPRSHIVTGSILQSPVYSQSYPRIRPPQSVNRRPQILSPNVKPKQSAQLRDRVTCAHILK